MNNENIEADVLNIKFHQIKKSSIDLIKHNFDQIEVYVK